MNKIKGISIIIIAVVSVAVTVLISQKLLDTTGKVNKGNFRISDVIIESSATLTEVQAESEKVKKLSDLYFDANQTNTISILIESNVDAVEMNIENLKITTPELVGKMSITQIGQEKHDVNEELTSLPIYLEKEDGKYVIRLSIDNNKVFTDKNVGEDVKKIQYDATIFKTLGMDTSKLQFNVTGDLVIKDTAGKTVKTTINLTMPTEETFEKGMSILRQDVSKNVFEIVK